MAETVTLETVGRLVAELPVREQRKLAAELAGTLKTDRQPPSLPQGNIDRGARAAEAEAVLRLCDTAASHFRGPSDVVEDIRQMRDERVRTICQNGA